MKYDQVLKSFCEIAVTLEEDEEHRQWFKWARDLEKEMCQCVPEFQAVVAFSQHTSVYDAQTMTNVQSGGQNITPNTMKAALLADSAEAIVDVSSQLAGPGSQGLVRRWKTPAWAL
jgi:hypothetical protein